MSSLNNPKKIDLPVFILEKMKLNPRAKNTDIAIIAVDAYYITFYLKKA